MSGSSSPEPGLWTRLRRRLPLMTVLLAVGVGVRLANYAAGRSLWLDEASLALNIASRTYLGLLQPLDYNQTAPLLFLWAERLMVQIGGVSEYALRFVPLLSGIATLVALRRVADRLLPPPAASVALAMAALSHALIIYSIEVKPYAVDALVAVVLLGLSLAVLKQPESERAWRRLLVAAAAGVMASTAAPLTIVGLLVVLFLAPSVRASPQARKWLFATSAITALMVAVIYLMFYRDADSAYLHTVWRANFLSPGSPDLLERAWRLAREVVWGTFHGGNTEGIIPIEVDILADFWTITLSSAMVLGAVAIARQHGWPVAGLLLAPGGVTLAASAMGVYPISLRLVLYLVPFLILLAASGIVKATMAVAASHQKRALVLVPSFVLMPAAFYVLQTTVSPLRIQSSRTVIRDLERRAAKDEPVYVFSRGLVPWVFYTTDWSRPDTARLAWMAEQGGLYGPSFENAAGRGRAVAPDEGGDLVYRRNGREELIGLSTGVRWLALGGFSQGSADRRWAAREARRIRERAHPTAWLFFAHAIDRTDNDLVDAIEHWGGTILYRRIEPGASVFQVRFQPASGR